MKRVVSALLVISLLMTGLSACSKQPDTSSDTTTTTAATTTTAPTTTTTTAPSQPIVDPVEYNYNPLTGVNDLKSDSNRPVAIMVTNEPGIIGNQYGIDKADFYMETEAEGSVPRIMAVFASADRIPAKFGPIRSARTPFIATANALGAVYVYSGATTYVTNILKNMKNFDRITNTDKVTLWRDSYLSANANVSWNNLITGGEQIAARMEKNGVSMTATKTAPFTFGEKTGDVTANTVQLKSTASTNITFIYDAETGLYGKNNGKAASCKPQESLEGNQIQVSNVLVLYAEKYVESKNAKYTWYNFRTGTGSGYIVSGGTAREIKFTRTENSLSFTEADGTTPLAFAEGKTYMVLADKKLSEDISFS